MPPQKPAFLKPYFWDINFEKFNPKKHPKYTIERVLEHGNDEAVRWCFKNFPKDEIKQAVLTSRVLTKVAANFWALYFDIHPREQVLCLSKSFQEKHRLFWPY